MRLSRLLLFVFRLKDIRVFETTGWFLRPLAPCVLIQLCWAFLGGREELVVVDEGDDGHVKEPEGWRWLCLCIVYDEVVEVKLNIPSEILSLICGLKIGVGFGW
jgi:hypothetical protein